MKTITHWIVAWMELDYQDEPSFGTLGYLHGDRAAAAAEILESIEEDWYNEHEDGTKGGFARFLAEEGLTAASIANALGCRVVVNDRLYVYQMHAMPADEDTPATKPQSKSRLSFTREGNAYRVRAEHEFRLHDGTVVPAGTKGGLVWGPDAMPDADTFPTWVADGAEVRDRATVCDFAVVLGHAQLRGDAAATGHAEVSGDAVVRGAAWVRGHATVSGRATVSGHAVVQGHAVVEDDAKVGGTSLVADHAHVFGRGVVKGNMTVASCQCVD